MATDEQAQSTSRLPTGETIVDQQPIIHDLDDFLSGENEPSCSKNHVQSSSSCTVVKGTSPSLTEILGNSLASVPDPLQLSNSNGSPEFSSVFWANTFEAARADHMNKRNWAGVVKRKRPPTKRNRNSDISLQQPGPSLPPISIDQHWAEVKQELIDPSVTIQVDVGVGTGPRNGEEAVAEAPRLDVPSSRPSSNEAAAKKRFVAKKELSELFGSPHEEHDINCFSSSKSNPDVNPVPFNVSDEIGETTEVRKRRKPKSYPCMCELSESLQELTGKKYMTGNAVINFIRDYVSTRGLLATHRKSLANCDDKLRSIFNIIQINFSRTGLAKLLFCGGYVKVVPLSQKEAEQRNIEEIANQSTQSYVIYADGQTTPMQQSAGSSGADGSGVPSRTVQLPNLQEMFPNGIQVAADHKGPLAFVIVVMPQEKEETPI